MKLRSLVAPMLAGAAGAPAIADETLTQTVEFNSTNILFNVDKAGTVPLTLEGTFDQSSPLLGELQSVTFEAEASFLFTGLELPCTR